MRLDSAAQKALNVMKQRTDANDNFSLYGLMSRGRTAMARRLLKVLSHLIISFELSDFSFLWKLVNLVTDLNA